MPELNLAHLMDRGVIRIAGTDADKLLDGLITNSLAAIPETGAIHTGLLSPQGKILFDFFLTRDGDDLLIDIASTSISDLIKRLSFYRLRADVTFTDQTDQLAVTAAWGTDHPRFPGGILAFNDPRNSDLGQRLILPAARLPELPGNQVPEAAYHSHRIKVGIPEAGRDFELGNTFPHEALYDQLGGVDFKKGCFIGQEVVSRMQHRGTARKRIVPVVGEASLSGGVEVTAGEATIGQIGSISENHALALLRLDRANEALSKGIALTAGQVTIAMSKPNWLRLDITTGKPTDKPA